LQELRSSIAQAESALPQRLQREPTDAELAGELGVSREVLDEARSATKAYRTASLDAAPPYAVAAQLREDRDDFEELLTKDELRRALAGLSEREREILRMRFVEECSQSEIGRAIGVSQMQVSRLLSQALRTLRGTLGATEPAA
jgi:RNA polymerase sigma-B factor